MTSEQAKRLSEVAIEAEEARVKIISGEDVDVIDVLSRVRTGIFDALDVAGEPISDLRRSLDS